MSRDDIKDMVEILIQHYSLAELEDKLNLKTEDIEDSLMDYVDRKYKAVKEMLKEDLFL